MKYYCSKTLSMNAFLGIKTDYESLLNKKCVCILPINLFYQKCKLKVASFWVYLEERKSNNFF